MVANEMIFLFFRLLNLSILVGGAIYLFYRYGLGAIREKIQEQKDHFAQLYAQEREHKRKSVEIKRMIIDQDLLCEELQLKVNRWNATFDTRKKDERLVEIERQKVITQIVKIQNYSYIRTQLEHTIVPIVLRNTEQSLVERYTDKAADQAYLAGVIEKMDIASSVAQMRESDS